MTTRQQKGKQAEKYVAQHLAGLGFRILGLNVYTRWGEIDIIAVHEDVVHAVEVKARTSNRFGNVEEAITRDKLAKMKKSVQVIREDKIPFIKGRTQFDFAAVEMRPRKCKITMYWNINDGDFE